MNTAAPAATPGFEIRDWRPRENGTLLGFCTIVTAGGMIIHNCALHEKSGRRWFSMPNREYQSREGERKFERLVEFIDRTAEDRFQALALSAIDRYLAEARLTNEIASWRNRGRTEIENSSSGGNG